MHRFDSCVPAAAHGSPRLFRAVLLFIVALAGCGDVTEVGLRQNPLAGLDLYVPNPSNASMQAEAWRDGRPDDAAAMDRIAREPRGVWLTDDGAAEVVRATLAAARSEGTVPLLVAYNIPGRDCTDAGAAGPGEYREWVRQVAGALRSPAIVIVEPDALAAVTCVPDPDGRLDLLAYAASAFGAAGAFVYIDAGHPRWLPSAVAADRLRRAGVADATGFALNVANFVGTAENVAYGRQVALRLPGEVGFVIDTSRNGAGPAPGNEWCNPPGRKLGSPPTTAPPYSGVDALLWVKRPGESDGLCNGGPPAGEWWPEYALALAR